MVFAFGFALMQFIYAGSGGVPGNDSFYHIKMASMIPQHGLLHEFPWLRFVYFTDEGQAFVEHHHGFHLLLVPFVYLSSWLTADPLAGGRWAMAGCFGLVLLLFNTLLIQSRVRWRLVWLLLFLLLPMQFFTRHAYIRAICPSLVFMLLIVVLMFARRYALTALAIAGFIHLYLGGVIYSGVLVGLYVLACAVGPRHDRTIPWRLIAWSIAGWIVGVVTHPYAGGMADFLKLQVFGSGLSPDIPVGREWKSYEGVWWFARMCGPLLIAWATAICLRFRLGRPLNAKELFLLLANFLFLGLTMKARRFIEYWPMFCLLSAAMLAGPILQGIAERFDRCFDAIEGRPARPKPRRAILIVISLVLTAVTVAGGWHQWRAIRKSVNCKYNLPAVRDAMDFLIAHSEPGDVVFTDDWDIFPVYFHYNTHNHYIVGLDPKFTQARRPKMWARYVKVSRGQVPATVSVKTRDPSGRAVDSDIDVALTDIRDHFGARFVITDSDHKSLASKLARADAFAELIYPASRYGDARDAPYLIFKVRDADEAHVEETDR